MASFIRDIAKLAKALLPHGPDVWVMTLAIVGLLAGAMIGLDAWALGGFLIVMVLVYAIRQTKGEKHKERMAALEVEKKAAEVELVRERAAAQLARANVKRLSREEVKHVKTGGER